MAKSSEQPALEPAIFIIFGITGDLSQRKLLPALYHLIKSDLLHANTEIVGVTRRDVSADDLLNSVELCVNETEKVCDPVVLKKMRSMISMQQVDLTDSGDYTKLKSYLDGIEEKHAICMNRLFYLSIPPQVYAPIVQLLGKSGLNNSCIHGVAKSRLLIEKPFGYDLASAKELIAETGKVFHEDQIFRIDHYVAKETVQDILTFRFSNPLFAAIWDNRYISHIQITATEKIDIENRAIFYEETGALCDFIQSHLMQLLALLTMAEPSKLTSQTIHEAKIDLLDTVQTVSAADVWKDTVRGQYDGYREEVHNPGSIRETYAAVKLAIDSPQWRGVPVIIRTGKALAKKETKLSIIFCSKDGAIANSLRFRIQPDEGISLNLLAKQPGYEMTTRPVSMDFNYGQTFNDHGHPDAYERVLVDAVRGDHTLFSTSAEVLASWRILENVVQAWSTSDKDLHKYRKGTTGPSAVDELAAKTNAEWL
ncbi:MAG TPA: glucose-6-phosphate dehydrogenase [Candidatus Saccharimonadales bacterium]|nr:glucose-6-phosphate dehydrogenase [Candidatus Saccharimonadales bacterium]